MNNKHMDISMYDCNLYALDVTILFTMFSTIFFIVWVFSSPKGILCFLVYFPIININYISVITAEGVLCVGKKEP